MFFANLIDLSGELPLEDPLVQGMNHGIWEDTDTMKLMKMVSRNLIKRGKSWICLDNYLFFRTLRSQNTDRIS